jgi:hypothetical protein
VIIGLTRRESAPEQRRLFSYEDIEGDPVESQHTALSPYLFDAGSLANKHLVVIERSQPLSEVPRLISGTQPVDDGNYVLETEERAELLAAEPRAAKFIRPYIGSDEFINGRTRWILCLSDAAPSDLREMPLVVERMRKVKMFRSGSRRSGTLAIANYPGRYNVSVVPHRPFLCIPKVSSERREYVPIGWLEPPTIPSDLIFVLEDADLWHFGVLTSRMHMSWLRHIGGRLESRYRYSIGIVYNTFPWPDADEAARQEVREQAQKILDVRAKHPQEPFANLYDPDLMPLELRKAHEALDLEVDSLYRKPIFLDDRERVEFLFQIYEKLTAPLTVRPVGKERRRV